MLNVVKNVIWTYACSDSDSSMDIREIRCSEDRTMMVTMVRISGHVMQRRRSVMSRNSSSRFSGRDGRGPFLQFVHSHCGLCDPVRGLLCQLGPDCASLKQWARVKAMPSSCPLTSSS